MLVAGLSNGGAIDFLGLKCGDKCTTVTQCNIDCLNKGYKRGGTCYGFIQVVLCCCYQRWVIVHLINK